MARHACRQNSAPPSTGAGVHPRTIPPSPTMPSASARSAPERSSSRFSPTAVMASTARASITIPNARRATAISPSIAACARSKTSTRSCISARMARRSGCPARRWRSPRNCWPRLAIGAVPVVYPFIVDDPGEAAPAKRRIGAVTIGHLTPQTMGAGLHGEAGALRELVEEFSSAQVLHPRPRATRGEGDSRACANAADWPPPAASTMRCRWTRR